MFTYVLYELAGAGLLISFMKDKKKTRMALKKAWKSFENILPQLLTVMIIIGFALAVLSPETISKLIGSESGVLGILAAALIGAMGYGEQFYLIPYESAAEAAQAVARGEVDIAVSHQSQILETWQQGGVDVFAAFDDKAIAQGPFAGVEGVGQYGYPYFRNRCFIFAKAGADEKKIADIKALYAQILADAEMVDWLNNTMLLEADVMTEEATLAHIENVKNIVTEYYDLVAE